MEDLDDEVRSEIAGLLVEANPQAGLSALQRILEHLPRDQLLELKAGRRHIVWALEKLAWLPETFVGAARLLLSLAEAENEEWGNNATGIWIGLFGTHLGATAVPALERHKLVEEALESSSRERQLLAVDAIAFTRYGQRVVNTRADVSYPRNGIHKTGRKTEKFVCPD
jgi:hypothetical protein